MPFLESFGGAVGAIPAPAVARMVLVDFDFTSSSPVLLTPVLPGDVIAFVDFVITTPFNDPAATAELGSVGVGDEIFTTAELDLSFVRTNKQSEPLRVGTSTNVQLTLVPGASTQGAGYMLALIKRA